MTIYWKGEALCLHPESEAERKGLSETYKVRPRQNDDTPSFSGWQEPDGTRGRLD